MLTLCIRISTFLLQLIKMLVSQTDLRKQQTKPSPDFQIDLEASQAHNILILLPNTRVAISATARLMRYTFVGVFMYSLLRITANTLSCLLSRIHFETLIYTFIIYVASSKDKRQFIPMQVARLPMSPMTMKRLQMMVRGKRVALLMRGLPRYFMMQAVTFSSLHSINESSNSILSLSQSRVQTLYFLLIFKFSSWRSLIPLWQHLFNHHCITPTMAM